MKNSIQNICKLTFGTAKCSIVQLFANLLIQFSKFLQIGIFRQSSGGARFGVRIHLGATDILISGTSSTALVPK
jgi:hypothetical protein